MNKSTHSQLHQQINWIAMESQFLTHSTGIPNTLHLITIITYTEHHHHHIAYHHPGCHHHHIAYHHPGYHHYHMRLSSPRLSPSSHHPGYPQHHLKYRRNNLTSKFSHVEGENSLCGNLWNYARGNLNFTPTGPASSLGIMYTYIYIFRIYIFIYIRLCVCIKLYTAGMY